MKEKTLETKAWYRLVKVLYVSSIIFVSAFMVFVLHPFPKKVVDLNRSYFVCQTDSSSFALGRQTPEINDAFAEDSDYLSTNHSFSSGTDRIAKYTCRDKKLDDPLMQNLKVDQIVSTNNLFSKFIGSLPQNYTLTLKYTYQPSFSDWISEISISFLILWLCSVVLKAVFFYIVVGHE